MLAEVKANMIHLAARGIIERTVRPIPLERKEGATMDSARFKDRQHGNFRGSANDYYSVYSSSHNGSERANALIGLTQQLINLGSFRQTRRLLHREPPALLNSLSSQTERWLFQAQLKSKEGWINDYEIGYFQSKESFLQAAGFLIYIPRTQWRNAENELYSTIKHFTGRALYGLAFLGVDKERNIKNAVKYFNDAIDLDQQLGVETGLKVGFGHGWLARCYLTLDETDLADEHLETMRKNFIQHLELTPGRGVMAHYHLLKGMRFLQNGLLAEANNDFSEAFAIRTDSYRPDYEMYPKGEADACLGLSKVAFKNRDIKLAAGYFLRALRTHPYAVLRSTFGG